MRKKCNCNKTIKEERNALLQVAIQARDYLDALNSAEKLLWDGEVILESLGETVDCIQAPKSKKNLDSISTTNKCT